MNTVFTTLDAIMSHNSVSLPDIATVPVSVSGYPRTEIASLNSE